MGTWIGLWLSKAFEHPGLQEDTQASWAQEKMGKYVLDTSSSRVWEGRWPGIWVTGR